MAVAEQRSEGNPSDPIEVVSIKPDGIDLRIRNVWNSPISIGVCDEPKRLSGLASQLELFTGKEWRRAEPPEGTVYGDLPPNLLQIDVGKSVLIPVRFSPQFMGIAHGAKVRVVVTVWHTETSLVFGTPTTVGQESPLRVASLPFAFVPTKRRAQQTR